jgi:hypothetical protein
VWICDRWPNSCCSVGPTLLACGGTRRSLSSLL